MLYIVIDPDMHLFAVSKSQEQHDILHMLYVCNLKHADYRGAEHTRAASPLDEGGV